MQEGFVGIAFRKVSRSGQFVGNFLHRWRGVILSDDGFVQWHAVQARSPDGFTGYVALLTHGVGYICGSRMSSAIKLSRATQMASLLSIGTLCLACCTGPFRLPILSKEIRYIAVSCSLSVMMVPTGSWNIGFSLHRGSSFTEPTLVMSWGSCWHWSCPWPFIL